MYRICCTEDITQGNVVQTKVVQEKLYRQYCTGKCCTENVVQVHIVPKTLHKETLYRKRLKRNVQEIFYMNCCTKSII